MQNNVTRRQLISKAQEEKNAERKYLVGRTTKKQHLTWGYVRNESFQQSIFSLVKMIVQLYLVYRRVRIFFRASFFKALQKV